MKKVILTGLFATLVGGAAFASDYTETYTSSKYVRANANTVYYVEAQRPASAARPCARKAAAPVAVKTHSEVINHYAVYQPVTVYQPVGTYSERVVVPTKTCNRCGY